MAGLSMRGGLVVAFLAVFAGAAGAQEQRIGATSVELGFDWTQFTDWYTDYGGEGIEQPSLGMRVTVPITPRFAIEGSGTIGRRQPGLAIRTEGFYGVSVRQTIASLSTPRFRPFATYGVTGYYAYVSQPAITIPQRNGPPIHVGPYNYREVDAPIGTVLGGGGEYYITNRVALRGQAQVVSLLYLPLGFQYSVGMAVSLGQ